MDSATFYNSSMNDMATSLRGTRERKKDDARNRIADAVIALMAEGRLDINHDAVADATAISRRTIYRYFPDRQALLAAGSTRVRELAGTGVAFPSSEEDLLNTHPIYTGLDRVAPIATLVRSTPYGRAMRLSEKAERQASYTAVAADAVKDLPQEDRQLATAMLQVLHTTPWLEMRDHWDLSGEQIARATAWAIRTLLADLRTRGGKPLDQ
jgi:AcrR family transcriptional regulator